MLASSARDSGHRRGLSRATQQAYCSRGGAMNSSAFVRPPLGPFARALHEALECATGAVEAHDVLEEALARAGLVDVPEELAGFRGFVEGALDFVVRRTMGPGACELVRERLGHVLWMASSTAPRSVPAPFDREDPSGVHEV